MGRFHVFVTDQRQPSFEIERRILEEIGADLTLCNCVTEDDIIQECTDADAVMLDLAPMTGKAIRALKKCKVISRYGVGVDNVDLAAADECGVQVCNVPDYCMEDVSDHAIALLFACLRNVVLRDREIRKGSWNIVAKGFRVQGKTLGVIGAGRIARALVRKLSGFDLREVVAYDPFLTAEQLEELGMRKVEFDELLHISDFVSLHLNLTDETRNIIDADALSKMKETAILINVSRGGLVDSDALLNALENDKILCAGLDTHAEEPVPKDSRFMTLDNIVMTDHAAYNTVEGVAELKEKSARNIAAVLLGKRPVYPIECVR